LRTFAVLLEGRPEFCNVQLAVHDIEVSGDKFVNRELAGDRVTAIALKSNVKAGMADTGKARTFCIEVGPHGDWERNLIGSERQRGHWIIWSAAPQIEEYLRWLAGSRDRLRDDTNEGVGMVCEVLDVKILPLPNVVTKLAVKNETRIWRGIRRRSNERQGETQQK
jgi:hypothetical protein